MQFWLICFMTVFLVEAYGDNESQAQGPFPFNDEKSADLGLMLRGKAGSRACQAKIDALDAKVDQDFTDVKSYQDTMNAKLDQIITLIQDKDCKNRKCEAHDALGMESRAISDAQITASSKYWASLAAIFGRLHSQSAWTALTRDANQWLQIDLSSQDTVTRVATQGSKNHGEWVTEYKLQYSNDGVSFQYYKEEGQNAGKVFAGNADQNTVVYHDLNPPITARYFRFRPVSWRSYLAMRVELYGCQAQGPFPVNDEKSADLELMLRGKGGKAKSRACQDKIDALDAKVDQDFTDVKSYQDTMNAKLDQIITLTRDKDCCCNNQGGAGSTPRGSTCKEVYDKNLDSGQLSENKAYPLEVGSAAASVYCHMTELEDCGGGGWTLVMKTDGTKNTFGYDSSLWSSKKTFNPHGGATGFDSQETKLPTYWNTPFSKICLGMKIGKQIKFIVINKQASSLYSLIADGKYRATSLGRNEWKKLIGSDASLQKNCNKEGFNAACTNKAFSKARIGFLGNNENDCSNCDSRIGFGTGGSPDDTNTCGNDAAWFPDNFDRHIKAMGYIFVQ